jgi:hypothetical protein
VAVAFTVVLALCVWAGSFVVLAFGWNWLMVTTEGEHTECWWAECPRLHEFTDDHDLALVIGVALLALLPAALVARAAARPRRGR